KGRRPQRPAAKSSIPVSPAYRAARLSLAPFLPATEGEIHLSLGRVRALLAQDRLPDETTPRAAFGLPSYQNKIGQGNWRCLANRIAGNTVSSSRPTSSQFGVGPTLFLIPSATEQCV